jgi:hypothetical protein
MFLIGYVDSAKCGVRNAESQEPFPDNANSARNHSALDTSHSALIPVLGIPACGMYHAITVLDLVLPRVLAGETIGRKELAELGHGGLCLNCKECRYPVCPFGK